MPVQVRLQNNETKLIRECRRGNKQAINNLFHRHRESLFQSARRIMGNAEDAEDALQDGLLSAFRNVKRFEGRSKFSTWLTRIVINAALMRRRGMSTRIAKAAIELPDSSESSFMERLASNGPNPEQLFGRQEIHAAIKDRLDELAPILRTVFILRIVHECTTKEAAEILDVSANTVKARLWRARCELARRVSRNLFSRLGPPQRRSTRLSAAPRIAT
jgi:RNA polymerase sigma-70 factor (ECF subfamily)